MAVSTSTAAASPPTRHASSSRRWFTVVIVGSGFGGQSAAIQLRRIGIHDFRILERRPFMGGTWMQNSYPGAAVDVQSPLYSLAGEPYDWTQMFAKREELEAYTNYIIDKHDLRTKTDLRTRVEHITWNDGRRCWEIRTSQGETLEARFVINATGPLSSAAVPDFEGKDTFEGASFHTNHWDHRFDYRGKRVAIIGSGASAAQVIPAIAPDVAHLHVFQRTPHWVLPRPDWVFRPWQRRLLRHRVAYKLLREAIYWGLEARVIAFKYSPRVLEVVGTREALKHLRSQVPDREMQEILTPDFTIGCKRILVSNDLYPALVRENVTLHSREDGIRRITPHGIETTGGGRLDLDGIIYATGFDPLDGMVSYPVEGIGGRVLQDQWKQFPRAYLGTTVPGFPNFFIVTGPNTGIGHTSALHIIESQMRYIMRSIKEVRRRGVKAIEVQPSAEATYTRRIHEAMQGTVWQAGGCTSWYQNPEGKVVAIFPGFSFVFRWLATRFRRSDHHLF